MNETTPRDFDALAAQWDENPARLEVARNIAQAILDAVPVNPDFKTLDFGAGTGLGTFLIAPEVNHVTALDTSAGMLSVLVEKATLAEFNNISVLQHDVADSLIPAGPFDMIFSSMALHHVMDAGNALKRLADALKQSGWLAIADLDAEDGSFHPDPTGIFHNGFDAETMQAMFTAAGLTQVTCKHVHTVVRPDISGIMREYPILLTVGQKPA